MLPLALCKSRGWLDMLPLSDQPESQQEEQMLVKRLRKDDRERARETFTLMANVFETRIEPLSDSYLDALLERESFWALAAFVDGTVVGGLTAHTLPVTRLAAYELFIYDIAVHPEHQRQGIGRLLMHELQVQAHAAGIHELFVLADNEDTHALDFYRALGGTASPVTMFDFKRGSV